MEPFFGGLFAFAPASLLVFGVYGFRKQLRQRGLFGISLLSLAIAVVTLGMDTILGGLSPRYSADFTWLFLLASILIYTTGVDNLSADPKKKKMVIAAIAALIAIGVFLGYMNLLSDGRYSDMSSTNPLIYRYLESWLLFLQ